MTTTKPKGKTADEDSKLVFGTRPRAIPRVHIVFNIPDPVTGKRGASKSFTVYADPNKVMQVCQEALAKAFGGN